MLSAKRDRKAAKKFLKKVLKARYKVVALALRHVILPKNYSVEYELHEEWVTYGLPQHFYTDIGKDFRSNHLNQVSVQLDFVCHLRDLMKQTRHKIESLKSIFISNSFITLIGDYVQARILHQLHYWSYSEYGVVINDVRWIYKPLREWLSEVFTYLTDWKLIMAIASLLKKGLIRREKLFVKHHELKHDNPSLLQA